MESHHANARPLVGFPFSFEQGIWQKEFFSPILAFKWGGLAYLLNGYTLTASAKTTDFPWVTLWAFLQEMEDCSAANKFFLNYALAADVSCAKSSPLKTGCLFLLFFHSQVFWNGWRGETNSPNLPKIIRANVVAIEWDMMLHIEEFGRRRSHGKGTFVPLPQLSPAATSDLHQW